MTCENPIMTQRLCVLSVLTFASSVSALGAGDFKQFLSDDSRKASRFREEEIERVLIGLEKRCKRMVDMQVVISNGIKNLHKSIAVRADIRMQPQDRACARKLAAQINELAREVNKAIELLEKDGSAVAFPEVFHQLRIDMRFLQRRLENGDVGVTTRELDEDILGTLQEMIGALKKCACG